MSHNNSLDDSRMWTNIFLAFDILAEYFQDLLLFPFSLCKWCNYEIMFLLYQHIYEHFSYYRVFNHHHFILSKTLARVNPKKHSLKLRFYRGFTRITHTCTDTDTLRCEFTKKRFDTLLVCRLSDVVKQLRVGLNRLTNQNQAGWWKT